MGSGYGATFTPWGKIVLPELASTWLSPEAVTGWFSVLAVSLRVLGCSSPGASQPSCSILPLVRGLRMEGSLPNSLRGKGRES